MKPMVANSFKGDISKGIEEVTLTLAGEALARKGRIDTAGNNHHVVRLISCLENW